MNYQTINKYELRRKFFKLFGASINVTNSSNGQEVGFIKMKAWTLREDIRLFTDNSQQTEELRIHSRQIVDFGATYDVIQSSNDQPLFALRRKGLKSAFVRDHWNLLTNDGQPFGYVQETSGGLAVIRRYVGIVPFVGGILDLVLAFFPQTYTINFGNEQQPQPVAQLSHRKNPIVVKMDIDITGSPELVDNRIPLAVAALLMTIDAAKN